VIWQPFGTARAFHEFAGNVVRRRAYRAKHVVFVVDFLRKRSKQFCPDATHQLA
jgi:hypothetical protein